jgi:hypothetical protein
MSEITRKNTIATMSEALAIARFQYGGIKMIQAPMALRVVARIPGPSPPIQAARTIAGKNVRKGTPTSTSPNSSRRKVAAATRTVAIR